MDPRQSKRAIAPNEQEEKEEEHQHMMFPSNYSSASADQDVSAMVSALSHVIRTNQTAGQGSGDDAWLMNAGNPASSLPISSANDEQGIYINIYTLFLINVIYVHMIIKKLHVFNN